MKILFITDYPDRAETELIINVSRKFDVSIMTKSDNRNFYLLEKESITIYDYKVEKRFDPVAISYIRENIINNGYDIVHAFNSRAISCAIQAGKNINVKILGYRGVTTNNSFFQIENWFSYLHPRLNGVFCVAEAVRKSFYQTPLLNLLIPKNKFKTIYKGHKPEWYNSEAEDLQKFGVPADAKVICCLSRNSVKKGVLNLLQAFSNLPKELNSHLLLVGNIDKNKQVIKFIDEHNLKDKIHFTGYINNPTEVIKASDLLVSASQSGEGLPRVVIEAMCVKTPVVATDSGGTSEVVVNGITGLLVNKNSTEELQAAITKSFIELKETEHRVDNAYRRISETFNSDDTARKTIEWYKELVQSC